MNISNYRAGLNVIQSINHLDATMRGIHLKKILASRSKLQGIALGIPLKKAEIAYLAGQAGSTDNFECVLQTSQN